MVVEARENSEKRAGRNFLPMTQILSIFSGDGKFCLAYGLEQLTR